VLASLSRFRSKVLKLMGIKFVRGGLGDKLALGVVADFADEYSKIEGWCWGDVCGV